MIITKEGKYTTRDGRKVEILKDNYNNDSRYTILALITDNQGVQICESFTKEGYVMIGDLSPIDIIEYKEKKVGWINVYKYSGFIIPGIEVRHCSSIYKTEKEVLENTGDRTVSTIKIEWTE